MIQGKQATRIDRCLQGFPCTLTRFWPSLVNRKRFGEHRSRKALVQHACTRLWVSSPKAIRNQKPSCLA